MFAGASFPIERKAQFLITQDLCLKKKKKSNQAGGFSIEIIPEN